MSKRAFGFFVLCLLVLLAPLTLAAEYATSDWITVTGTPRDLDRVTLAFDGDETNVYLQPVAAYSVHAGAFALRASEDIDGLRGEVNPDQDTQFRFIATTPGISENGKEVRVEDSDLISLYSGSTLLDKTTVTLTGATEQDGGDDGGDGNKEVTPGTNSWSGTLPTEEKRSGTNTTTNALLLEDTIHLCGQSWNVNHASAQAHGVCGEVQEEYADGTLTPTFICSANSTTMRWYEKPLNGVVKLPQLVQGTPEWQVLQEHGVDLSGREAIACDGGIADGVPKLTPPPDLRTGYCSPNQCADLIDGSVYCVPTGSTANNERYFCDQKTDDARWASVLQPLANELLSVAPDEQVRMNCGPSSTVNNQGITEDTYGYCQLTIIKGGETDEIIMGVAFKGEQGPENFVGEAQKIHPEITEAEDPEEAEDRYSHDALVLTEIPLYEGGDPELDIGYFSNKDLINKRNIFGAAWGWITGLFTDPEAPTLSTQLAEQFYFSNAGGEDVRASVEYIPDTCDGDERVIVSNIAQPTCYNDHKWRQIIQGRVGTALVEQGVTTSSTDEGNEGSDTQTIQTGELTNLQTTEQEENPFRTPFAGTIVSTSSTPRAINLADGSTYRFSEETQLSGDATTYLEILQALGQEQEVFIEGTYRVEGNYLLDATTFIQEQPPQLQYEETFESLSPGDNYYANNYLTIQEEANNQYLETRYKPNSQGTPRIIELEELEAAQEYELSYRLYFEEGFEFVKGGKLHGLTSRHPIWGCTQDTAEHGWSVRSMWKQDGQLIIYYYDQDRQAGDCGKLVYADNFNFQTGQWYDINLAVRVNDVGQNNGEITLSVDGQEVATVQDVELRGTGGDWSLIENYTFNTFFGGSDESWAPSKTVYARFDDIRVRGAA